MDDNDNVPVIGDCVAPNLSPRTPCSDFIAKEYDSLQNIDESPDSSEPGVVVNGKNQDCEPGIQVSKAHSIEMSSSNLSKPSNGGGLSERIAGRAGFGNLTLDTSQIRKKSSFSSPTTDRRSPLLTIPPGLSPTMLLGSPLFVSNCLTEPFPTTGKMDFMECDNITAAVNNENRDQATEDVDPASFSFKLPILYFSCAETKPALSINPQQPNPQDGFPKLSEEDDSVEKLNSNSNSSHDLPLDGPRESDVDPKGEYTSASLESPTADGYNWRNYGQKNVKGSEFPRSYYKCTHPDCRMKKKVERNHVGRAIEINYKGTHNHSRSSTVQKSSISSSHSWNELQIDGSEQNEWKEDEIDANQYAHVPVEQCEQSNHVPSHDGPRHETPDGFDALSSNDDDEDERLTHGSASLGGDGDGDETESKRRKLDACALEMSAASRAVREPRVVVQTTSDIDVLDDGYRWRKYGQKVVKGNPNPRSYYKCTNPGCTVRKHVERASHDFKSVITTYEGKHNHEVPTARAGNPASSPAPASIAATSSSSSCLPRKVEPASMPDCFGRFVTPAPPGPFRLPGRDQQSGPVVPNFPYAMAHQGFNPNFAMAGLGKMSVLPPLPAYMSQHHPAAGVGFMVPKMVPKEEPAVNSRPPGSSGSSVYQSLSRMPLGPQL